MNRKDFIRYTAFGASSLFFSPSIAKLLSTPKKFLSPSFTGKVIVVGAGISGMYAAWLLNEQGIDVTVLEASDVYGGRIKSLKDFSDFPIELGAEHLYNRKSVLYQAAKNQNTELIIPSGDTYYSIDGFLNTEDQLDEDPDFKLALAVAETFADYSGPDIPFEQFALQQGVPKRIIHILNGMVGNKYGASISKLSMPALSDMERAAPPAGDDYLLKTQSLLSVVETQFKSILPKIKLNTQVSKIDYTAQLITLTDKNGGTYTTDKLIITVPITILKSKDITFVPDLPEEKTKAFSKIGMGPGMKIVLKFNKRFWKDNTYRILGFGYVNEFYPAGASRSSYNNVLIGTTYGENAAHLSFEGKGAADIAVKELDKIINSTVASRSLMDSYVMDWLKHPYIRGAFSYPSIGSENMRTTASSPVNNKLFFAGEALNTSGKFGSLYGAMETSRICVDAITKS